MIVSPAVIALIAGSWLVAGFAVYASSLGIQILRRWDMASSSAVQLALERKTVLISTLFGHLLVFELVSLFLFAYTADHMHPLFVGAMCAAGSLNANDWGYMALVMKFVGFLVCGLWLIVNRTDQTAPDYPLVRFKYKLLLFLSAVLVLDAWLVTGYYRHLRADVITSCCAVLFSEDAPTVAGAMAEMPFSVARVVFFLGVLLCLRTGAHFVATGRSGTAFSALSTWQLVFSVVAIISFIGPYFYEQPYHHCPFCLIQREYHYVGYPLYLALLTGGVAGLGVGVLGRFKAVRSLETKLPAIRKRLCLISMGGHGAFALIAALPMVFSDFRLGGY